MTGSVDQIDDAVEQRIRSGFAALREDVAASADIDAARAAVDTMPAGRGRPRRSARVPLLVAAAAVVAVVVGFAAWPRDVSVTTTDGPDRARKGSTSTVPSPATTAPATTIPTTTIPTTTIPTTTIPQPPVVGDASQHLIVGGQLLSTFPKRSNISNPTSGSREPDGSGCSPGGDYLPDGLWYGYLAVADGRLWFDLACRYSEHAATWAIREYEHRAADDWEERFVLNESTTLRPLPLNGRSEIVDIANPNDWTWQEVSAEQLGRRVEQLGTETPLAAWVRIVGGRVEWLDVSGDNYAG